MARVKVAYMLLVHLIPSPKVGFSHAHACCMYLASGPFPIVLGNDLAGTVVAVGPAVKNFRVRPCQPQKASLRYREAIRGLSSLNSHDGDTRTCMGVTGGV